MTDTEKRIAEIKSRYHYVKIFKAELFLKPSVLFDDTAWLLEQVERLKYEVDYLNRMLADERSGDCDKDKTIRRLEGNNATLELLAERYRSVLAEFLPIYERMFAEGRDTSANTCVFIIKARAALAEGNEK